MTRTTAHPRSPYGDNESEAAFQTWVIGTAEALGWDWFHDQDPRRDKPGLPDLLLKHDRARRLLALELKSARGEPTAEQLRWLAAFSTYDHAAHLFRPRQRSEIARLLDVDGRGVTVTA